MASSTARSGPARPTGIEPRFVEIMKLMLPLLTNAEFQAVAGCGTIISAVESQELRQGYAAQMLDEVRHTQLEMALRNYYVKHAATPRAGTAPR